MLLYSCVEQRFRCYCGLMDSIHKRTSFVFIYNVGGRPTQKDLDCDISGAEDVMKPQPDTYYSTCKGTVAFTMYNQICEIIMFLHTM